MTEKKAIFGKRLRAARREAGLTQKELGDLLGLEHCSSTSRISRFESDTHMPHHSIVEKMAAALKVPSLYFYCTDEALAKMFVLLSERLGRDWECLLLAQMREMAREVSAQPELEYRQTRTERRLQVERRIHPERRNQVDRRGAGQHTQSMSVKIDRARSGDIV